MSEEQHPQDSKKQEPPPMPSGQEPPPMPSGSPSQSRDESSPSYAGPGVKENFKTTAKDSWSSLKGLWKNPETGIANALNNLGHQKAMFTGIFLIVSIALVNYLFIRMASPGELAELFTIENSFRLIVQLAFPGLSLAIVFLLANLLFKTDRNHKDCIFMAGMVSLPMVLPGAGLVILGYSNIELHVAMVVASMCFLALLTYSTFRHVLDCDPRKAFILTPITLLAMAYITSVFSRMWMEGWMESLMRGVRFF